MNPKTPPKSRRFAVLRLCLYLTCIAAVSGIWLARQAHAELGRRALSLGREIDLTVGHRPHTGTTEFRVNGQEAALNSRVVSEPIDTILDRFEKLCARESGGVQEELDQAIARGVKLQRGQTFGVFRTERGQKEATAACFARKRAGGLRAFLADVGRALDTGDLSEVGQLNYVFARVAQDKKSSHVLTVWSRGALKVEQMFPERGDAPGIDLAPGARPPSSLRVLSAETNHREMAAIMYESDADVDAALSGYASSLERVGYHSVLEPSLIAALPVPVRVYRKDGGGDVYLLAERHDDKTLVLGLRPNSNGYVTQSF